MKIRKPPAPAPTGLPNLLPLLRRSPDAMKTWTFISTTFKACETGELVTFTQGILKARQFTAEQLCWLYTHGGRVGVARLRHILPSGQQRERARVSDIGAIAIRGGRMAV